MTTTWTTNNLTLAECATLSGWTTEQLAAKVATPGFANTAKCKAAGAWDANDRDGHALWTSLENLTTADVEYVLARR